MLLDTIPAIGVGCDTILTAQLIFRPWPVLNDTLSACEGDSIIFGGKIYLSDTTLTVDTLPGTAINSCDTIVRKVLILARYRSSLIR